MERLLVLHSLQARRAACFRATGSAGDCSVASVQATLTPAYGSRLARSTQRRPPTSAKESRNMALRRLPKSTCTSINPSRGVFSFLLFFFSFKTSFSILFLFLSNFGFTDLKAVNMFSHYFDWQKIGQWLIDFCELFFFVFGFFNKAHARA